MDRRVQVACAWCAPVFLVLYGIFFWGVAGFIPPPSPKLSATDVAALFDHDRNAIRIGALGAMISSFLIVPFFAAISARIGRGEKGMPILAMIQFGMAVLLEVFFVLCSMLWIAATYRPELADSTVRMLNDLSWLTFVMVYPGYVLQMICIAIAALRRDGGTSPWPRWVGYLSLWVALSGTGGGFAVFFTNGPLAWNGVIGFYIPIGIFAIWMLAMAWVLRQAALREPVTSADPASDSLVDQRGALKV